MNKLVIIVVAIAVLIILGTMGFLYMVGEEYKQTMIGPEGQPGPEAITLAIIVTGAVNQNPSLTLPGACLENSVECVDLIAPDNAKTVCKEAFNMMEEHTKRVRAENPVSLGLNVIQISSVCPPKTADLECLEKNNIEFYGIREATAKTKACADELK